MLNVRLPKEIEEQLKKYADQHDLSKTTVVKEALTMYLTRKGLSNRPYELGIDLFGNQGSDQADNSTTYKSKIKKKLREKYTH